MEDLTSIIIPESVTSTGDSMFSHCSSLTSITIPAAVTSIGDFAFDSCNKLSTVVVNEKITRIIHLQMMLYIIKMKQT